MATIKLHIPIALSNNDSGYVYGNVISEEGKTVTFYVYGRASKKTPVQSSSGSIIGFYMSDPSDLEITGKYKRKEWILFGFESKVFTVYDIKLNGNSIDLAKHCNVICILYNEKLFTHPELLMNDPRADVSFYGDFIKTRTDALCTKPAPKNFDYECPEEIIKTAVQRFFYAVILFLLAIIKFLLPILKYVTLGLHLQNFLETLAWALESCLNTGKVSLKVGNFIVATCFDIMVGIFVLHCFMPDVTSSYLSQDLLGSAAVVINTIESLLEWLMGIPAGLKLNQQFNNMLGKFFLYHIKLWWTFLWVMRPVLEFVFKIFLCFGYFGISFQVAILVDLLALVSFHIYCIYVYAARLYNLQVLALTALFRLFLGKKYNPLRNKVDSCEYSTNQLFVGTLAFTILLFLLPTTFMYYIVFMSLRVILIGLGGLLTRVRFVMQALPLYVTLLWLVGSAKVTSTIHLSLQDKYKLGPLILHVTPTSSGWLQTVSRCIPDPVTRPPAVEWSNLLTSLASGKLVYPV